MKIAVAGTGYVGLVAGVCFAQKGYSVICVDLDESKIRLLKSGVSPIYEEDLEYLLQRNLREGRLDFTTDYSTAYKEADVIFIGVGTPERPDGSADLTGIAAVARQIAEVIDKDCLVVVKSTVPVGTNDKVERFIRDFLVHNVKVEVASNPEFLSQGRAIHDMLQAERIIIGAESRWARDILMQLYKPFNIPIVAVSRRSAEMIKYASNVFLALKLSYMNEIANLCELVGADIVDVARGMSYDSRIGSRFLNAGIGYGGSCFPKDTKALEYLAYQYGYELRTVKAAIEVNREQNILLFRKASRRLITFHGLKVAVLGLTFKPGTDDIRGAPSLENISLLLENGADVYAYDPVGADNCKRMFPEGRHFGGSILYVKTIVEALEQANICFIFTEWQVIRDLKPELFTTLMRTPLVYDGRNIYDTDRMRSSGVEYYSVGRSAGKSLYNISARRDSQVETGAMRHGRKLSGDRSSWIHRQLSVEKTS